MKLKDAYSLEGKMSNLDSIFKSRDITLPTKLRLVKAMVYPVVMMDVRVGPKTRLSPKELMLLNCGVEKTPESPSDCKGIQPVHPKGHQSWLLIGRTDAEAETPILWPSDAKNSLVGKDPDAGERLKAGGEGGDRG